MTSETTNTESPSSSNPFDFIRLMVTLMLASISSDKSTSRGVTPHCKFIAIRVLSSSVKANTGGLGRFRENNDAICPCFVYTKIASTARLLATKEQNLSCLEQIFQEGNPRKKVYDNFFFFFYVVQSTNFNSGIAYLLSNAISQ